MAFTELKQSRWVKVHEPGETNIIPIKNVMDILLGEENRCQANVVYKATTIPNYKKAVFWTLSYLGNAGATQIRDEIADLVTANCEDCKGDLEIQTDKWFFLLKELAPKTFQVQLTWISDEPLAKKNSKGKKKKVNQPIEITGLLESADNEQPVEDVKLLASANDEPTAEVEQVVKKPRKKRAKKSKAA